MPETAERVPGRRRAPVLILAGLCVLGVLALVAWFVVRGSGTDQAATSPSPSTSLSLEILPGVNQPGARPASSETAKTVLEARFPPRFRGADVVLEQDAGSGWEQVASGTLDQRSRAVLLLPADLAQQGDLRARASDEDGAALSTPAVSGASWEVVFEDSFRGSTRDAATWSVRQPGQYNPEGFRACSTSDRSAVAVSDGALELSVLKDPERPGRTCRTEEDGLHEWYLNGHVSTVQSFAFTHGVAAARVKFQKAQGQHGAFWLKPVSPQQIPGDAARSGAEIDVAEYFGEGYPRGGLASFIYYLNSEGENEKVGGLTPGATDQLPTGDAWWRRYHVFSVEWTPEEYVFRVDGREIYRTSEGVSHTDQFLILSLLSSDWELAPTTAADGSASMYVDWVRVWERAEGSAGPSPG